MHAFNCRVKFYLSILRSFNVAGYPSLPDHLQCLPAHGGSVNNKCFTKSIKKLSTNKSDRLIVYEVCVTLASSTQQCYAFVYFTVVFSVQRFLNMQKSPGGHKKIYNFAVIEGNQMPLGSFMCIWTGNKCVKFHIKIPSGSLGNGNFRGYFFAAHCTLQASCTPPIYNRPTMF